MKVRYGIIYVWKIVERLFPNLSDPITCFSLIVGAEPVLYTMLVWLFATTKSVIKSVKVPVVEVTKPTN